MAGVNKVILIGHLGDDPVQRTTASGTMVVSMRMATTETYKDKTTGQNRDHTEWHNIVLWRGLAEVAAKYLHKGDQVYIEGRLRTRNWEKEGVTHYITEVVTDNMTMLNKKSAGQTAPPPPPASSEQNDSLDKLPFE